MLLVIGIIAAGVRRHGIAEREVMVPVITCFSAARRVRGHARRACDTRDSPDFGTIAANLDGPAGRRRARLHPLGRDGRNVTYASYLGEVGTWRPTPVSSPPPTRSSRSSSLRRLPHPLFGRAQPGRFRSRRDFRDLTAAFAGIPGGRILGVVFFRDGRNCRGRRRRQHLGDARQSESTSSASRYRHRSRSGPRPLLGVPVTIDDVPQPAVDLLADGILLVLGSLLLLADSSAGIIPDVARDELLKTSPTSAASTTRGSGRSGSPRDRRAPAVPRNRRLRRLPPMASRTGWRRDKDRFSRFTGFDRRVPRGSPRRRRRRESIGLDRRQRSLRTGDGRGVSLPDDPVASVSLRSSGASGVDRRVRRCRRRSRKIGGSLGSP